MLFETEITNIIIKPAVQETIGAFLLCTFLLAIISGNEVLIITIYCFLEKKL